jgi:hypothetical protein
MCAQADEVIYGSGCEEDGYEFIFCGDEGSGR